MRVRAKRPEPKDPETLDSIGWERLPGESARAYSAFSMFRDLGAKRSLTSVAKNLNPDRPISVSAVSQWASKYRWRQRCFEYDFHEQREVERQLARQRRAARERQIQLAVGLQTLGAYGLLELQRKIERGEPLNLRPDEIITLAKTGQKLERMGLGEEHDQQLTKICVYMNGRQIDAPEPEPTPPEPKVN